MTRSLGAPFACALLLGTLAACASQQDAITQSREYYRQANFEQAYWVLEDARKANPGDETIRREYLKARLAFYLRQGQEQVFMDHELDAVQSFEKALTLDPENAIAKTWIDKAKEKLAARAVDEGDNFRMEGDLEKALRCYNEGLAYVPGEHNAVQGVQNVSKVWEDKRAKARDHYLEGVRALTKQLFGQTVYHMFIAKDNDPSLAQAETHEVQAKRRIAEQRFARASEAAKSGRYGAALMEYQAIKREVPDFPAIDERIAAMQKQTEAQRLVHDSEMAIARGRYDEAQRSLEQAYDMSDYERPQANKLLVMVRERSLSLRYNAARDLEIDYKLEEALAAYQALEKDWPAGFQDVRTRIGEIESRIELAKNAYAAGQEAEKKGDVAAAIAAYREALLFYPTYHGLDHRLQELKAQ